MHAHDDLLLGRLAAMVQHEGVRPVARLVGCSSSSLYRWIAERVTPLPVLRQRIALVVAEWEARQPAAQRSGLGPDGAEGPLRDAVRHS